MNQALPNLSVYEKFLANSTALKEMLTQKVSTLQSKFDELSLGIKSIDEAHDVMNAVSILSQEETKGVIEDLVTQALQAVYGETYSFEIENRIQRGQPETYLYVVIGNDKYLIKGDELGGGVIDVVSFALRVVIWAINDPKTDNVLILDEPLKNLDNERLILFGNIIKELSKALGLQMIIVTHENQIAEIADASYYVKKEKEVSIVEKIT